MSTPGEEQLVSIADIAEMAGTSRSAVSNWRKRYEKDFPDSIDGAGSSPQFRLTEVEAWLRRHGRFRQRASVASAIWNVLDRQRGHRNIDDLVEIALAMITWRNVMRAGGQLASLEDQVLAEPWRADDVIRRSLADMAGCKWELGEMLRPLENAPEGMLGELTHLLKLANDASGEVTAYEEVLERQRKSWGRGAAEFTTTPILVDILLELAQPTRGVVMYDGTIGAGTLALEAVRRVDGEAQVFGQEINDAAWRVAKQRFRLHDYTGDIRRGDTIAEDCHPSLKADLVISEPPFGLGRRSDDPQAFGDPRWRFGPLVRNLDLAWLQNAIFHLGQDGRAFVLTTMGPTFRGGAEARMRAEMLRAGVIEALFALPPGLAGRTGIPLALWVLCRPGESTDPDRVLLVDASGSEPNPQHLSTLYRAWRTSRRVTDDTSSSAVPLLDLLGPEATLVPAQWLERVEDNLNPEELVGQIHETIDVLNAQAQRISAVELPHSQLVRVTEQPNHLVKLGDLVDSGQIKIERASVRLPASGLSDAGVPAVTAANVRDRNAATRFIAGDVDDRVMTKAGDVLLVAEGGLFAQVETTGGRIPTGFVNVIRVGNPALDPHYLAAVLTSEWNKRYLASGTTAPRAKVRDLDVPAASPTAQRGLLAALERLQAAEGLASDFLTTSRLARERILDGELSGKLVVDGEL